MSSLIVPVARALYLCDYHVGYHDGQVDLYGQFNAIRVPRVPHTLARMVVFAQLTGGLGDVPFFVDVRHVERGELIHTTNTRTTRFRDRLAVVQLAYTIEGCRFPDLGLYTVELFCHNTPVCDTTVRVLGPS